MQLFVKHLTGNPTVLEVDPKESIVSVVRSLYEKRDARFKKVSLLEYPCAVSYLHGGRKLELSKTLSDYNIHPCSTINEIGKSWTMAYNVDKESMTIKCPITSKRTTNVQFINCGHVFDRDALQLWLNIHNRYPVCNFVPS